MYVYCKNTDCFWHSDVEPNKCTRGLIIIGEDISCKFATFKKENRNKAQNTLSSALVDEDGFPIT